LRGIENLCVKDEFIRIEQLHGKIKQVLRIFCCNQTIIVITAQNHTIRTHRKLVALLTDRRLSEWNMVRFMLRLDRLTWAREMLRSVAHFFQEAAQRLFGQVGLFDKSIASCQPCSGGKFGNIHSRYHNDV